MQPAGGRRGEEKPISCTVGIFGWQTYRACGSVMANCHWPIATYDKVYTMHNQLSQLRPKCSYHHHHPTSSVRSVLLFYCPLDPRSLGAFFFHPSCADRQTWHTTWLNLPYACSSPSSRNLDGCSCKLPVVAVA